MKIKFYIISILSSLTVISCSKEAIESTYVTQSEAIGRYVESQIQGNPNLRAVYNDGVVRLILAEGEGDELGDSDRFSFYYEGYDFSSSSISTQTLFATNKIDLAKQAGWETSDSTRFELISTRLKDNDLVEGLRIGLEGVRVGEDCYVIFNGKFGFGKKSIGTIPANAPLAYRIQVTERGNN